MTKKGVNDEPNGLAPNTVFRSPWLVAEPNFAPAQHPFMVVDVEAAAQLLPSKLKDPIPKREKEIEPLRMGPVTGGVQYYFDIRFNSS